MRSLLFPILACLLLTGCALSRDAEPADVVSFQPVQSVGYYQPDSDMELATGCVRTYPLENHADVQFEIWGEDVLLFSESEDGTMLTRLTGSNLYAAASCTLNLHLPPDDPSVCIIGDHLWYPSQRELICLDRDFQEIRRIPFPPDAESPPLLTPDERLLYYCAGTAVRELDLGSGINRIVRENGNSPITLRGLHFDGRVLECDAEGNTLFLSAEDGSILGKSQDIQFYSGSQWYFARITDGITRPCLFGRAMESPSLLEIQAESFWFLPALHSVAAAGFGVEGYTIALYDLSAGSRIADLTLPVCGQIVQIQAADLGHTYILTRQEQRFILYCWDCQQLPAETGDSAAAPYHSRDNPDLTGLQVCRSQAEQITASYGVEVLIHEEAAALSSPAYDLEPEHLVDVLSDQLDRVEACLSQYPVQMLQTLTEHFGGITLLLVRQVQASAGSGNPQSLSGALVWENNRVCIAISAGDAVEYALYSQLYQLMDTIILNKSVALDQWETLNPAGFQYAFGQSTEDFSQEYLRGETMAFANRQAMNSPKEDRGAVMACAMMPNNGEIFSAAIMQRKLEALCTGIRRAFGLRKSRETFPWEQYLAQSMAYAG